MMRILFLGDVVGRSGRKVVVDTLPRLISDWDVEFVIVNGENAAGGFGITKAIFEDLIDAGADVVTTGNHVWDQKEALLVADQEERFLRPANYPDGTPGRGAAVLESRKGARILVANIMGRLFMHPQLNDPFECAERLLADTELGKDVDCAIIDFHAEATSEKQCFAHFLDGRVSAVIGTHTHVPTSDHQILNGGTAYVSDAGMCGDYDSSLGMEKDEPINRFVTQISRQRMEAASGEATLCGLGIEIDQGTGLATSIGPVRIGPRLEPATPW